jgi:hypothetical protein
VQADPAGTTIAWIKSSLSRVDGNCVEVLSVWYQGRHPRQQGRPKIMCFSELSGEMLASAGWQG